MQTIQEELARTEVGAPITVENLTMFPLLGHDDPALAYATLDVALAERTVIIEEVSDAGSVPELKLTNGGELPVLLIDGEELVGAKQNRILNLTILAAARVTTLIPVSCVEAGRWSRRSATFASGPNAHYAAGRAMKMEHVTRSMRERGNRRSDQSEVWADIAAKSRRMASASPTGAMADMYADRGTGIDQYVAGLSPVSGQTGAAFAIDGVLVGLELFDTSATMTNLLPKLVRSFAIDAIERRDRPDDAAVTAVDATDVTAMLGRVSVAEADRFAAVGLGDDIRINSDTVAGAALVVAGRVVHLSAFSR